MKFLAILAVVLTSFFVLMAGFRKWVISTKYAAKYSDTAFRKIKPGSLASHVVAELGPPFSSDGIWPNEPGSTNNWEFWIYSEPTHAALYQFRALVMSNGMVDRKERYIMRR